MSAADAQPVSPTEARRLFAPFEDQTRIIVAVSGGPDSIASRWRASRMSGPELIAVTVDHGLRPEARREAEAVGRLAQNLGIAHRTLHWTGAKPKTGIQEAARNARYALIAKEAKSAGARQVLTAHTLDDQAETVLFRLLCGSGLSGLRAMTALAPYPGDPAMSLARPLLSLAKARLLATLREVDLPFADDPSNRDPRHARPRLRQIMPQLAAEGLTAARLATLARRLVSVWEEGGRIVLNRALFMALPEEIGLRLLARAIAAAGRDAQAELGKLETLFAAMTQAADGAGFRRTLAGAMVTGTVADLVIEPAPPRRAKPGRSAGRRIPALTTGKTGPAGAPGTR